MARLFDDAQNEYLEFLGVPPVVAAPFSAAAWVKSDSPFANQTVVSIGDKDVGTEYWTMRLSGSAANDPIRWTARDGGVLGTADVEGYSVDTWHHVCAVEASANSRTLYLDGSGNQDTDVTASSPDGADNIRIGVRADSAKTDDMSGDLAWVAIWDIALSDDEVDALAAGWSPLLIRPGDLVAFWPLGGLNTTETDGGNTVDIVGGYDMTANSDAVGPGIADHPGGLIYPSTPQLVIPAAVAPVGAIMNQLQGSNLGADLYNGTIVA